MRYAFCILMILLMFFSVKTTAQSNNEPLFSLSHDGEVYGARWSADGRQILSWDAASLYLWDVQTQMLIQKIFAGSPNCLDKNQWSSLIFDEVRQRIHCADSGKQLIQVWDILAGTEIFRLQQQRDPNWLLYMWSPNNNQLLICCQGIFELWDVTTGQLIDKLDMMAGIPSFNHDGSQLVIPTLHETYIWEVNAAGFAETPLFTLPMDTPTTEFLFFANWNKAEDRVFIVGQNGYTELWSLNPLARIYTVNSIGLDSFPNLSPDEAYFIVDNRAFGSSLWDAQTGQLMWRTQQTNLVWSVTTSSYLFSLGENLSLIDTQTGEMLAALPVPYAQDVQPTSDEKYILTWTGGEYAENTVSIWELTTLSQVFSWSTDEIINGVWASRDDSHFLVWGGNKVHVWEFEGVSK